MWRKDLAEKLAQVLAALGTERAWVVHGEDGLDEITLAGKTYVAEALNGEVKTFEIEPGTLGLKFERSIICVVETRRRMHGS